MFSILPLGLTHDIHRLRALGTFVDLEFNVFVFIQSTETIALNGGIVYKHILAAIHRDKAISLDLIEPLYFTQCHNNLA